MSRQMEKTSQAVPPHGADYVTRVVTSPHEIDACTWDRLLSEQPGNTPFMRHAYLAALHDSGCASPQTGWDPHFLLLEHGTILAAACAVYVKHHSLGEYVFDWSWAQAYQQHGLRYYPKAVVAIPFTPVPGARLMAIGGAQRTALIRALIHWCKRERLSSLHLLFGSSPDLLACADAKMLQRRAIQFHWCNSADGHQNFDAFLETLTQVKRKKIRQERRKVSDAGVSFGWLRGHDITAPHWDFFYNCYERTYHEHGHLPYLNRAFFRQLAFNMPENWVLFIGQRDGKPIAASLIAVSENTRPNNASLTGALEKVAYGRYWGAVERVDCLHFEACYYQPIQWCIEHGYARFEGGAQGEHKMARALLPVTTTSAHWLAEPAFATAIGNALARESADISRYLDDLSERSPLRRPGLT